METAKDKAKLSKHAGPDMSIDALCDYLFPHHEGACQGAGCRWNHAICAQSCRLIGAILFYLARFHVFMARYLQSRKLSLLRESKSK
jgi:hypothetical protein